MGRVSIKLFLISYLLVLETINQACDTNCNTLTYYDCNICLTSCG